MTTDHQGAERKPRSARPRTVEYDPGWGWIARDPATGNEILPDHRWPSRKVAHDVVAATRMRAAHD